MLANTPNYILKSVTNLDEALSLFKSSNPSWTPIAGGTDMMVMFEKGMLPEGNYLNLLNIPELIKIEDESDFLYIGSSLPLGKIKKNPQIIKNFPMIVEAISKVGSTAIQNRATLGGNIVNASPAADTPPALLAYHAEIELQKHGESRWLPLHLFWTGYKKMLLDHGEIVTRIRLPKKNNITHQQYKKVGSRKMMAISKVSFCSSLNIQKNIINEVVVSFGSVGPITLRATNCETFLQGRELNNETINSAIKMLEKDITPMDDIRSTKEYRMQVAKNLLKNFLESI